MRALAPDRPSPVRVLYIAGLGRSGSTILGMILGALPGTVCLGELERIWLRGVIENQPCGCGQPFRDCAAWAELFSAGGIARSRSSGVEVLADMTRIIRTRHYFWQSTHDRDPEAARRLGDSLGRLYRAVHDVTGAGLIVDTSKTPHYARFLMGLPGFTVSVLHLVRDPRATVYSWQKKGAHPLTGAPRMRLGTVKAAGLWLIWNWMAGRLKGEAGASGAFRLCRYEDFADRPLKEVTRITDFGGLSGPEGLFLNPSTVHLSGNHILSGSFIRYKTGRVTISRDDAWRRELPAWQSALTMALTLPLMLRYGYPIRP